jgi:HK97 family phage prohead protease
MKRVMQIEVRAVDGDKPQIRGYAAVFNSLSEDLGGFREVIAPGAFRKALASDPDVLCVVNHSIDRLLGRMSNGTCRVSEDDKGLMFECDLPDTSDGRDVRELIKRGDMSQCSFGFQVDEDNWEEVPDEDDPEEMSIRRTVLSVRSLRDVSPVVTPAYPQTNVKAN